MASPHPRPARQRRRQRHKVSDLRERREEGQRRKREGQQKTGQWPGAAQRSLAGHATPTTLRYAYTPRHTYQVLLHYQHLLLGELLHYSRTIPRRAGTQTHTVATLHKAPSQHGAAHLSLRTTTQGKEGEREHITAAKHQAATPRGTEGNGEPCRSPGPLLTYSLCR